jgi:hypothetical protein
MPPLIMRFLFGPAESVEAVGVMNTCAAPERLIGLLLFVLSITVRVNVVPDVE